MKFLILHKNYNESSIKNDYLIKKLIKLNISNKNNNLQSENK